MLSEFVDHNSDLDPYPYNPDQVEQLVKGSGYAGAGIELNMLIGRYLGDLKIVQVVTGYVDELPDVTTTIRQRGFDPPVDGLLADNVEAHSPWLLIG